MEQNHSNVSRNRKDDDDDDGKKKSGKWKNIVIEFNQISSSSFSSRLFLFFA